MGSDAEITDLMAGLSNEKLLVNEITYVNGIWEKVLREPLANLTQINLEKILISSRCSKAKAAQASLPSCAMTSC